MQKLKDILNWRQRDSLISLSGQPTEVQLTQLAQAGVTHIINLGPHDNDGALSDEPGSVAAAGMRYIYIPVDFEAPKHADFTAFCTALEEAKGNRVHVHCIYNARVSAFFYRYAKEGRGGDPDKAFALMDDIWRPGGVWADFIGKPEDTKQPNRFKGYEYT